MGNQISQQLQNDYQQYMDESATNQPKKLVMLQARDGTLDEPVDAAILLPSDLLKSMLPDKCR